MGFAAPISSANVKRIWGRFPGECSNAASCNLLHQEVVDAVR
jgi:hypothetical protein